MIDSINPLELLRQIGKQAKQLSLEEDGQAGPNPGIKNLAFVVRNVNFYCRAEDVKEVAVCENLKPIPQTKAWLRGLVNNRGVLYSVNDLCLLAGYSQPVSAQKGHLLILSDNRAQSALLVDRVVGIRYFDDDDTVDLADKQVLLNGLSIFVDVASRRDGQDWFRLNVAALLKSETFREIQ